MYCYNCGEEIQDGSAFCEECGARLTDETNEGAGKAGGTKKSGKTGIVIVVASMICIVAVVLFVFLHKKEGKTVLEEIADKAGKITEEDQAIEESVKKIGSSNIETVKLCNGTVAAITEDGSLYMWGRNESGEVGNGTTENQPSLVKVLSDVVSIQMAESEETTCAAITKDGSLYMWGNNKMGQIGNGTSEDYQLTPVKVLSDAVSVSVNYMYTAAITEDGNLYMIGSEVGGSTENESKESAYSPKKVLSDVKSIHCSDYNVAAITEDGSLYTWGLIGSTKYFEENFQHTPVKVLSDVMSVEAYYLKGGKTFGGMFAALTEDGDLYTWGHGFTGHEELTTDVPTKLLSDVKSFGYKSSGRRDAANGYAITKDGSLYMWGDNSHGEVGNGTEETQLVPVQVLTDVERVFDNNSDSICGSTLAITEDGSLYMWGQLGLYLVGKTPVKVLSDVINIWCDGMNIAAITEDGSLYMWGNNVHGEIGNGISGDYQLTPVNVLSDVQFCNKISSLFKENVSAAITEDGSLYTWGYSDRGVIGNGTTEAQSAPVKILSDVVGVVREDGVGGIMAAVTEEGSLYIWGINTLGSIGNGTTEDQLTPYKVLDNIRLPKN